MGVFDYYTLESLICHSILVVNPQIFGQLQQTKFVFILHKCVREHQTAKTMNHFSE